MTGNLSAGTQYHVMADSNAHAVIFEFAHSSRHSAKSTNISANSGTFACVIGKIR